ncbi:MAG: hypothetical protein P4L43_15660 [Syntrophobacteraceae bacterium]|nr:hypothetical protein [Syntrophobacteraceae bacterium]
MNTIALKADTAPRTRIAQDEGTLSNPCKDLKRHGACGMGHNQGAHGLAPGIATWLKPGIPDYTGSERFCEELDDAVLCCSQVFHEFDSLPDGVQRVLVNMAFALGYELRDWLRLRAAVAERDWQKAAQSIRSSRYAKQAPKRCRRLADRMDAIR